MRARGNIEVRGVPLSRFVKEVLEEIKTRDVENSAIKRIQG